MGNKHNKRAITTAKKKKEAEKKERQKKTIKNNLKSLTCKLLSHIKS